MKKSFLAGSGAVLAVLVACGGSVTGSGTDGGTGSGSDASTSDGSSSDASSSFDAGSFCSGSTPRLTINGTDTTVISANGKSFPLDCCTSAELTIATPMYQALMNVLWRVQGGSSATIDLASPPTGFTIEMDLGCDPATASCATASPEERYTDGFSGTLQYSVDASGITTSYCLQIAETASKPHTTIHSMALWAPNVLSP